MSRAGWSCVATVTALLFAAGSAQELSTHYDTIVVGLGVAGSAAASSLARAGRRVLALEAQGRIGGRVWTRDFGDGIVETGAEWIHGTVSSSVYELALAHNVSILVQQFDGVRFLHSNGSVASEAEVDLINRGMEFYFERSEDSRSLGDYVTDKLYEYARSKQPSAANDSSLMSGVLNFLDLTVGGYEGCNSWHEVSANTSFHFLGGPETASWGRLGYRTLFDILLNTYNNGPGLPTLDIKLNSEVTSISWSPEARHVVVTTGGQNYTADSVIVTVSLGVLKERHATLFSPPLPAEKVQAIEVIPMGTVGKIILSFERPWWDHGEQSFGFLWSPQEVAALPQTQRWVSEIYATSAPMGSSNTISLWTIGNTTKLMETLSEEEVKTRSMELLRRVVRANTTIPEPTGMIRSTWFSNPFTRGTYSFDGLTQRLVPDAHGALAAPLRGGKGEPRVLFAGEATDPTHFSTVHGALDSGYREAQRLLHNQ